MKSKIRIYRSGKTWLMDTTTKVSGKDIPITVIPTRQEVELWLDLHPEDQEVLDIG